MMTFPYILGFIISLYTNTCVKSTLEKITFQIHVKLKFTHYTMVNDGTCENVSCATHTTYIDDTVIDLADARNPSTTATTANHISKRKQISRSLYRNSDNNEINSVCIYIRYSNQIHMNIHISLRFPLKVLLKV